MFFESGFNGTLCGSTWKTVWNNNDNKKSGAKYGCCPSGKYMSAPEAVPFSEDNSCSASCPVGRFSSAVDNDDTSCSCPAGRYGSSVENDESSCQLCPSGKHSLAGSAVCNLNSLPDGNGKFEAVERVGSLGGIVDDILGTDYAKKEIATKTYGPIENWDVSEVTNMRSLFRSKETFDSDLSRWDVSSVTNMRMST